MSLYAWSVGLLATAVFTSAVGVVASKHESRKLFVELQALERTRDELATEWNQLQIEQSTWATHSRVDVLARQKLGMEIPAADAIVLVMP